MSSVWYTDGACSGNPGPGGYGIICLSQEIETNKLYIDAIHAEYCKNTTNNREELKAILYVMKLAAEDPDNTYIVYSDSSYAVKSINEWIHNWAMNNWLNSKKKEVENIDLMKEIYKYLTKNLWNFQLRKVKGHDGELGNELADAIASRNKQKYLNLIKKNNIEEVVSTNATTVI